MIDTHGGVLALRCQVIFLAQQFPGVGSTVCSAAVAMDEELQQWIDSKDFRAVFDKLLERYEKKVFHLCYSYVHERQAAEDLTQESFLKVWRALPSYDGRAALSTWTYVIARNTCLSYLRREKLRRADSLDEAVGDAPSRDAPAEASYGRSLDIERMLGTLTNVQRTTTELFYLEGRSCEEVAELLGMSPGTVRSHLFRARRKMLLAAQGVQR